MTVPHRRPHNLPLLTASISGAFLVVLVVVAWNAPAFNAPNPTVIPTGPAPSTPPRSGAMPTMTIVAPGMSYELPAAAFDDVVFELTMGATLYGAFSADANITAAILTTLEFETFESTGLSSGAAWGSGPAPGGVVAVTLSPGTYYLVFANLAGTSPALVHVDTGVEAAFPDNA
ncbi:MAG TPA: hypothetical protein VEY07_03165 [Thermoplasmata archaeon]|nr:hypothetical protein [Thermoplasmata archaeon]